MAAKICKAYPCYGKKSDLKSSVGRQRLFYTFEKMWWNITKGAMVIEKGDRIGMLYLCPHNTDYSISVASTRIRCGVLES